MDNTDYEKLVYLVFNSPDGELLLKMLKDKFVMTSIVQEDGIIPSSIREGKSSLIRQFDGIVKRLKKEE